MTCSRFYAASWPHVISRMRSFTFWFWSSCDFIWDQRVPSRAKNEANAFQRGKKKTRMARENKRRSRFPRVLGLASLFFFAFWLFTLHFCFPLSGSKSKNFLQPVSPHCYIASCNPSLRLLPCLTNLSPEENKSAASLRNPVCDWSVACKKEAERDASPTPPLNCNLSCTSGYREAQREQCLVQEHLITL